ncbi:hypothetical protein INR49_005742 [Caranx melampygus]|nr:hypothetical protein INR49_005742 [Caranx melampygus]
MLLGGKEEAAQSPRRSSEKPRGMLVPLFHYGIHAWISALPPLQHLKEDYSNVFQVVPGFEFITYPSLRQNLKGFREPEPHRFMISDEASCWSHLLSSSSDTVMFPRYQNIQKTRLRKISSGPDSTKKSQKLKGAKIPMRKRARPAMSRMTASDRKTLVQFPFSSMVESGETSTSSEGLIEAGAGLTRFYAFHINPFGGVQGVIVPFIVVTGGLAPGHPAGFFLAQPLGYFPRQHHDHAVPLLPIGFILGHRDVAHVPHEPQAQAEEGDEGAGVDQEVAVEASVDAQVGEYPDEKQDQTDDVKSNGEEKQRHAAADTLDQLHGGNITASLSSV